MCEHDCACIIDKKVDEGNIPSSIDFIYKLKYNPEPSSNKPAILLLGEYEEIVANVSNYSEMMDIDSTILSLSEDYDVYHKTGDCQIEILRKSL